MKSVLKLYCGLRGWLPNSCAGVEIQMIALIIAVFALATLAQFGLSWWRATVARVADNPLSEQGRSVAQRWGESVGDAGFDTLLSLHETCPAVGTTSEGLDSVRAYYRVMESLKKIGAKMAPTLARWAQSEMDVCFRYVAVRIDQRMANTHAMWAELRTY